jgi:hypothetical protein
MINYFYLRILMVDKVIYTFGIDIGTGSSDKHSVSAISVIKHSPPDPHFRYVYAHKFKCSLTELSAHIYALWEAFIPVVIMLDPGGGGFWMLDSDHLGSSTHNIVSQSGIRTDKNKCPLVLLDDVVTENAVRCLQLFTPTMFLLRNSIGTMIAYDQLINWGHDMLQGVINNNLLISPINAGNEYDSSPKLREEVFDAINEARAGLMTIGTVQDADGTPQLTKNGFFSYTPKPDLAYSLMYGMSAMYLYLRLKKGARFDDESEPLAVGSDDLYQIGRGNTGESKVKPVEEKEKNWIIVDSDE